MAAMKHPGISRNARNGNRNGHPRDARKSRPQRAPRDTRNRICITLDSGLFAALKSYCQDKGAVRSRVAVMSLRHYLPPEYLNPLKVNRA